jgi:predicted nucleotidyltransferase
VAALTPLRPYLRGAPAGLPFTWDLETLSKGLNFTLTTTAGDLDLLGEITYGGTYDALLSDAEVVTVLGAECRCLSLEQLIQVKRATGRVKDLEALAELEAIAEERRR